MARDTVRVAQKALEVLRLHVLRGAREPQASNIEEVSYQILLGDKYFVSTDGGGGSSGSL